MIDICTAAIGITVLWYIPEWNKSTCHMLMPAAVSNAF